MKLSEKLQQYHDSYDFGEGLTGLPEQALELEAKYDKLVNENASLKNVILCSARKRDQLLNSLKRYGKHTENCKSQPMFFGRKTWPCDCGLDDAIARAGGGV